MVKIPAELITDPARYPGKGGDCKPGKKWPGQEYADLEILPFKEGYSTTGVIRKIAELVKEGKL